MNFTTLTFFLFLPAVFCLFWFTKRRTTRNLLLVAASYIFYGWWDYRFCALMLISSLVDFGIGWKLDTTKRQDIRRMLLGLSLAANLGLLGVFKYFNFFAENLQLLASSVGWNVSEVTLRIILPVGISFYTFQTLSYTIDIFRGQMKPCRSLIDYLAFVSFFPQLVAGPIERASRLLPQFAENRDFDFDLACQGCRQILWGFFKKIAVADRLAVLVNARYAAPDMFEGPELLLATVCFAFQIYCDFSAYSDIAIGTAKLFNIRLMRNFAYPYFSQSIAEFWRRWHISLSTWFRDYVFIPLGGNRTSVVRRSVNVLATFLISGLWHGAAWRFVVWGGVNGGAVVGEDALRHSSRKRCSTDVPGGDRILPSPSTACRMLATFGIVCLAWIFFRADSMHDAFLILHKVFTDAVSPSGYAAIVTLLDDDNFIRKTLIILLGFVLVEWIHRRKECPLEMGHFPLPVRWAGYTFLIWLTLDLMPQTGGQEFIYFEF